MQSSTPQQMQIRKILWFAFINAIVIYNIVGFITFGNNSNAGRVVRNLSFNDPVVVGIGAFAVLAAVGSILLARTPLTSSVQDYPKFLIRLAVAEVPSILGLVLSFTTLQPEPLWIASVVSIILLIVHRPQFTQTL
ncbi:MAG: hypothetical protein AAB473_05320 [Patescibacteria group bacterium]